MARPRFQRRKEDRPQEIAEAAFAAFAEKGFTDDEIGRIHGPVGLDIGAETPGETAISILAEMIQVRYGSGTGLSLRGREGRIHRQRTDDEGDV